MLHITESNIMTDIESFGRRPDGLVVSVGAVVFNAAPGAELFSGKPEHEFHAVLSWDAAMAEERFVRDADTLVWWSTRNTAAFQRLKALMMASKHDMASLMKEFTGWLAPLCKDGAKVWGNSPSFDLVMLENAAKKTGVAWPVGHRAESDYRTLTDLLYGSETKARPPVSQAHDALADARFQAQQCVQALNTLRQWRNLAELARETDLATA